MEAAWHGTTEAAAARKIELDPQLGDTSGAVTAAERQRILNQSFIRFSKDIEGRPDVETIIDAALTSMTAVLQDGHTYYLPKNQWEPSKQGKIVARGVQGESVANGVVVTEVMAGSSAEEVLKQGDVLVAANGISLRSPPASPPISRPTLR